MGDDDSEVEPSGGDVISLFLVAGIAFSFREFEGNHLRKQSMPVVSSPLHLFATPLLDTELAMVPFATVQFTCQFGKKLVSTHKW
jgi:hypothetical protein